MKVYIAREGKVSPIFGVLSIAIAGVLLSASRILFFFPDDTATMFAWGIKDHMTCYLLGAGYFGGFVFFLWIVVRVFLFRNLYWNEIYSGIVGIVAFTIVMALVTLKNPASFASDGFPTILWKLLYYALPFVLSLFVIANLRYLGKEVLGPHVNGVLKGLYFIVGITLCSAGIVLFLLPESVGQYWPWHLTKVTAQVVAGWIILPGVVGIILPLNPRLAAWRITIVAQMVSILLIVFWGLVAWQTLYMGIALSIFGGGLIVIFFLCFLILFDV